MKKAINYLKYMSIFLIIELMLTFIMSLLNLFGISSGITSILLLLFNIVLFFTLSFINAMNMKKKGFLEGIILGLIFIALMFLLKIILFDSSNIISTIIYYLILFITSIFGGMFGVNKKSDK